MSVKKIIANVCIVLASVLAFSAESAESAKGNAEAEQSQASDFLAKQDSILKDYAESRQKYLEACMNLASAIGEKDFAKDCEALAKSLTSEKLSVSEMTKKIDSLLSKSGADTFLDSAKLKLEGSAKEEYAKALESFSESFSKLVEVANKIPSLAKQAKEMIKKAPILEKVKMTDSASETIALGNQIVSDLKSAKETAAKLVKSSKDAAVDLPKWLEDFSK